MSDFCTQCMAPISRCICAFCTPCELPFKLIILQHPLEAKHAKNTGRLLWQSTNAQRFIGEQFSDDSEPAIIAKENPGSALLYPSEQSNSESITLTHVFLIDANWRKSLKMFETNPWLKSLPKISLSNHENQWSIRKAKSEVHLSTIEAAAALANDLGQPAAATTLNNNFLHWQKALAAHRPR